MSDQEKVNNIWKEINNAYYFGDTSKRALLNLIHKKGKYRYGYVSLTRN